MLSGVDAPIRLLIVNDDAEEAEAIVSHLRNAGLAIRPARAATFEELDIHLAAHPFDVLLAASPTPGMRDAEVMERAGANGRDLPVVVEVEHIDDASLVALTEAGARGIVLRGQFGYLQEVVVREFTDLEARRGLRRLEAQIRETERRCDALIESSRDPIAYVHEGMHIRANRAYLEMFGYDDFEDIEGMSLLDLIAPSHVADFKQLLKGLSRGESAPARHELEARDAAGNSFPAVMEFTQAKYEGEPCIQIVLRRQESDPVLAQEVEELRRRDMATGLLNRQTFLQQLEQLVGEVASDGSSHGLLLMETDQSAQLEQQVGLGNLDELAVAIAGRLNETFDEHVVIARTSENTYALLLRGSDHAATSAAAERLRAAFDGHLLETANATLSATVSVGGVQIGERIAQVPRVVAKATESLQNAAGMGGNRIDIFDPSATERAEEERIQAWVTRIREAISEDALRLYYQPIINLQDETEQFYESMLRMIGSDGHPIPPAQFVPMAEEHGLAGAIDRWALRRALRDVAAQATGGQPAKVLVKISQGSLDDEKLVPDIFAMLQETGAAPASLVLQLPESKVFTNLRQAQRLNDELRAMGAHFCIEHFGVGLNSLQLLGHFKPDFLKLNEDFITDFARSQENRDRVQEIVQKAQALKISCIARGVTDAATMTALFSSGVEYMQGDFIAPISERMTPAY